MDEPVRVSGGVEDGVQGCGKGVQGRRLEAEVAAEVRGDGACGVDPAEPLDAGLYLTTRRARVVHWHKDSIMISSIARLCQAVLERHT